jgi:hypothetical protein
MIVLRDRNVSLLATQYGLTYEIVVTQAADGLSLHQVLILLSYFSHGVLLETIRTRKYRTKDRADIISQKYIVVKIVLGVGSNRMQMHPESLQRACKR